MPDYKTIDDLCKALQERVEKAIQQNVPEVVVKEMQKQIVEVVYDAYEPKQYERKYYDGGLLDEQNFEITPVSMGVGIRSARYDEEDKSRYVSEMVESGQGYRFDPRIGARPFTEATRESLRATGKHVNAVRRGLVQQGLRVE